MGEEAATGNMDNTNDKTGNNPKKPPARKFLTRAGAALRRKQEQTVSTQITSMEQDLDPNNINMHEVLLRKALATLEHMHGEYMAKNALDCNVEPEKSYMMPFQEKVTRAIVRHKSKLSAWHAPPHDCTPQPQPWNMTAGPQAWRPPVQLTRNLDQELADEMLTSVSQVTGISTISKGHVNIQKIKKYQKKITAKATAVSNVINKDGIERNGKALAKAGVVWGTIEDMSCDYQELLEACCDSVEESEMEEVLKADEAMWEWMAEVQGKLEELLIMKDSPSKKENMDNAFMEDHKGGFTREPVGMALFLQEQAEANRKTELLLKAQEDKYMKMEDELKKLKLGGKQPGLVDTVKTDAKSMMRLPSCQPPKFTGENIEYLPWKRQWLATMGKSYLEEVQLMQMKTAIPERTRNLIGLVDIRTMADFWDLMDAEYLDYNQLSRSAIADVKSLDRKDSRFLQMMLVKLQTHRKNLELSNMGHRITSDEMVREEWLPMLTNMAKEDWLKRPSREAPLWPHFVSFLEGQAQACKERERLSLASTPVASKDCSRCKSRFHTSEVCKAVYCSICKTWRCNNRSHRKPEMAEQPWSRRQTKPTSEEEDKESFCPICKENHPWGKHTVSRVDSVRNLNQKSHMQSASKCHRCLREVREAPQTCGACDTTAKPGEKLHCYDHCLEFMRADPEERLRQVTKHGDCTYCLYRDHDTDSHLSRAAAHPEKLQQCGIKENGKACTSNQNAAFHGAVAHRQHAQKGFHTRTFPQDAPALKDSGLATIRGAWEKSGARTRAEEMEEARRLLQEPEVDGDRVLLLIQEVVLVTGKDRRQVNTSLFFDKGSTCSMVTKKMVKLMGLESIRRTVVVQSFGHTDTIDTEFVVLEVLKEDGLVALIRAYVVESITSMAEVDIPEELKRLFRKGSDWPSARFHGEIDILLGIEELALHPKRIDIVDNLGIFRSPLSSITMLGGRHEKIHPAKMEFSQACMMMKRAPPPGAQKMFRIRHGEDMFQLGDNMGDYIPKTCNNCRQCTSCTFAGRAISQKDRLELDYIERGITYNEDKQEFNVKYPFLEDPKEALSDNRKQAIAYGLSLEKKLVKGGLREQFETEFQKFIESKSLREIGEEEMETWQGAVHYVPLQLVVNEASQSTPFRIVTNTSCKDPKTGKSLNSITCKGPNMLSDPYRILLRFRNRKHAITTDVTKAYHGLRTGEIEMHLRRVVYRKTDSNSWKTYGFLCVSFGDIAAQAILECCLQRVAKLYRDIDWVAALIIEVDRFVDDLPSGSDMIEVINRLRGEILDSWQTTGTLAQIFAKGGFKLKVVACSGDKDGPMVQKLGGAVLGIAWNTETDKFSVPLTVNVSRRRRGLPSGPDVTEETLLELDMEILTRRIVLSVTMSLYDPLGYTCPLTLRMKWLIQELGKPKQKKGWDEPLTKDEKGPWIELFRKMVKLGRIVFNRSCKPRDVDLEKEVILVTFMDGSDVGKAFAAYIRYILMSGNPHVSLLAAKSKLNPAGGQSTPRSEMDGHTLGARGTRTIADALKEVTPTITKVYMLGDSQTCLQALKAGATPFSEWFANRIGEIYDCMRDLPAGVEVIWGWVKSKDNGADIASRTDANPGDLVEGSEWQNGPAFLQLPEADWPIDTDIMKESEKLPREEMRRQFKHQAFAQRLTEEIKPAPGIQAGDQKEEEIHPLDYIASRTNSWETALSRTRYISHWSEKVRTKSLVRAEKRGWISRLELEERLSSLSNRYGLSYWLKHAGKATMELMKRGGLKNMVVELRMGIPMVQTRFKVKTQHYFGASELPLILASTGLGYLLCQDAHEKTHRSGDLALSYTKQTAYVVGAKQLLLSIRRKCMICRKENAFPLRQRMGDMPAGLQLPERGFKRIAVDLAGPFLMKADLRRRSTRKEDGRIKVWVAVVACSLSSAVKLYLCRDYSEEGFMQAWRRHVCNWGEPVLVYSDRGSQLVSAAGGLDPSEPEDSMNWGEIERRTGVKWFFTPAQAQWRNGRAEALVKGTKHSLKTTFKFIDMDFLDFSTTLAEISFILNSRPVELLLGAYKKDGGGQEIDSHLPDSFTAITPNDLLIGSGDVGSLRTNYCDTGPQRLAKIENKVAQWHSAFIQGCQDRLFCRDPRWTKKELNVQVGDAVWMIQESKISRSLKWGIVKRTFPDQDGVVREVTIRYGLFSGKPEPYVAPFTKKGPFKDKLVPVQNLAMFYSKAEQGEDMEKFKAEMGAGSARVDMLDTTEIATEALTLVEVDRRNDQQHTQVRKASKQSVNFRKMVLGSSTTYKEETESNKDHDNGSFPEIVNTTELGSCVEGQGAAAPTVKDKVSNRKVQMIKITTVSLPSTLTQVEEATEDGTEGENEENEIQKVPGVNANNRQGSLHKGALAGSTQVMHIHLYSKAGAPNLRHEDRDGVHEELAVDHEEVQQSPGQAPTDGHGDHGEVLGVHSGLCVGQQLGVRVERFGFHQDLDLQLVGVEGDDQVCRVPGHTDDQEKYEEITADAKVFSVGSALSRLEFESHKSDDQEKYKEITEVDMEKEIVVDEHAMVDTVGSALDSLEFVSHKYDNLDKYEEIAEEASDDCLEFPVSEGEVGLNDEEKQCEFERVGIIMSTIVEELVSTTEVEWVSPVDTSTGMVARAMEMQAGDVNNGPEKVVQVNVPVYNQFSKALTYRPELAAGHCTDSCCTAEGQAGSQQWEDVQSQSTPLQILRKGKDKLIAQNNSDIATYLTRNGELEGVLRHGSQDDGDQGGGHQEGAHLWIRDDEGDEQGARYLDLTVARGVVRSPAAVEKHHPHRGIECPDHQLPLPGVGKGEVVIHGSFRDQGQEVACLGRDSPTSPYE